MKYVLIFFFYMYAITCKAQELYVFSESASTRPAKSLSLHIAARFPDSKYNMYFRNRYTAQATAGINKNWTIAVGAGFSNYYRLDLLQYDGVRLYTKYRLYSNDDVHTHLRVAAFAEGAYSTHDYIYDEMTLEGDNNGVQGGLIATQLAGRFAVSATASYLRVFNKDIESHHTLLNHSKQMVGYSLSAGYLLLPKEYTSYKQMNLNLYLELLGSKCLDNDHYLVDIAPALQFIFNSKTKVNFGYRRQMASNMLRVGQSIYQVGVEQSLYNVW